jgi:hypothetical protein
MKIDNKTYEVLKNFATIQKNLVIQAGNKIKTISEARHILAEVDVPISFPTEVTIYDLDEFLGACDLVSDADHDFQSDRVVISNPTTKVVYHYASKNILTYPEKDLTMPPVDITFTLTENNISSARKAAATLGYSTVSLKNNDGKTFLSVVDPNAKDSSNSYDQSITGSECEDTVNAHVLINNLKLLPGDYKVEISRSLISKWTNQKDGAVYFIALEKTSEFGS